MSDVESKDGYYLTYTYTKKGTPLGLKMPLTPGDYEIRYVLNQDRVTTARQLITLTAAEGTVSGPATAAAGSKVIVDWTGPNYEQDYITIARADADATKYESYTYTKKGSPLSLDMPSEAGEYELRYVANGKDDTVLARQPIVISAVTAELSANDRVKAGENLVINWKGPGYDRDYITISEADDSKAYLVYKYAREGSPVILKTPDTPGTYELRYFLDKGKVILARRPLVVE